MVEGEIGDEAAVREAKVHKPVLGFEFSRAEVFMQEISLVIGVHALQEIGAHHILQLSRGLLVGALQG